MSEYESLQFQVWLASLGEGRPEKVENVCAEYMQNINDRVQLHILQWSTHLEAGTKTNNALHVCAVVTQNILSTKQRDLIFINRYLQPQYTHILMNAAFEKVCPKYDPNASFVFHLYDFI